MGKFLIVIDEGADSRLLLFKFRGKYFTVDKKYYRFAVKRLSVFCVNKYLNNLYSTNPDLVSRVHLEKYNDFLKEN